MTLIAGTLCVIYMRVPDALCIIFASPIITIIASAIILRDKINLAKILAGIVLFSGVILVCKPEFILKFFRKLDHLEGNQKEVIIYFSIFFPKRLFCIPCIPRSQAKRFERSLTLLIIASSWLLVFFYDFEYNYVKAFASQSTFRACFVTQLQYLDFGKF